MEIFNKNYRKQNHIIFYKKYKHINIAKDNINIIKKALFRLFIRSL